MSESTPTPSRNPWVVRGLIAVPVIMMASCTVMTLARPEAPKDYLALARAGGESSCERAVKARLKSPTSAQFDTKSYATASTAGFTVKVSGTVDSQNSFGAMIRSNFACVVTTDAKGAPESTRVESLG